MRKKYTPLAVNLFLLLIVVAMQVIFLADHAGAGYLIFGSIMIFMGACSASVQIYYLLGDRQ